MEKALLFQNTEDSTNRFYMLRLSSVRKLHGEREVVCVGVDREANPMSVRPDDLFGPGSKWKFMGGRVYES